MGIAADGIAGKLNAQEQRHAHRHPLRRAKAAQQHGRDGKQNPGRSGDQSLVDIILMVIDKRQFQHAANRNRDQHRLRTANTNQRSQNQTHCGRLKHRHTEMTFDPFCGLIPLDVLLIPRQQYVNDQGDNKCQRKGLKDDQWQASNREIHLLAHHRRDNEHD